MKKAFASIVLATGLLFASAASQAAIILFLSPSQTNVAQGAAFSVDVNIKGLGSEIVSAFDINILFGGAIVNSPAISINLPEFGVSVSGPPVYGAANARIDLTSLETDTDLAALQTDDAFRLMTLSFLAGMVDGSTTLTFGTPPAFGSNIVGSGANSLVVELQGACVSVGAAGPCAVPEPTSYALVGLGLFAAFAPTALRRRKTAA